MIEKYFWRSIWIQACFLGIFSFSTMAQDIFDIARNGTALEVETVYKNTPSHIDATNDKGYTPLILATYHEN